MNSLSDCIVFQKLDKVNKLTANLSGADIFKPYIVPPVLLERLMYSIRTYSYSLSKIIFNNIKNNKIRFVIFSDPYNTTDVPKVIPFNVYSFMRAEGNNIISYVDVSMKGKFTRDKSKEKVPVDLKLDSNEFYSYAQSGFLNNFLYENKSKIMSNHKLLAKLAEAYAILMCRALDKHFAISSDISDYNIMMYITAAFFYQFHCGFNARKANTYTQALKIIDKGELMDRLPNVSQNGHIMSDIKKLLEFIAFAFKNKVRVKMDIRLLTSIYSQMYGRISILSMEHFFSFTNMLLSANIRSNMFNDSIIRSIVTPKNITEIEKMLGELAR